MDRIGNADPQAEAARQAQGLSLRTFLASLTTSASFILVEIFLFVLLKDRLKQI